ncbi:hypothetical protein HPB50_019765 [Hyalomma asiaticum]|uniref:Uncharacterized protein n=1 Tax=Hyalomma asiaticum TaxID=266040 RepID=A0ACB7RVR6_HYAAI|nr:hypothetical protein HPB50_019765 [Hyalomma asiaticum]
MSIGIRACQYEPLPGSASNFKRARPVFDISFNDYIATTNGCFNFLEIVGGIVLNVLMGSDQGRDSKARRLLSGSAYTFSFNGFFMMFSSMLNSTSAVYLPALFYYVLFQGTGAACYFISGIMIARQTHEVSVIVEQVNSNGLLYHPGPYGAPPSPRPRTDMDRRHWTDCYESLHSTLLTLIPFPFPKT